MDTNLEKTINIRMTDDLHRRATMMAKADHRGLADYIRVTLEEKWKDSPCKVLGDITELSRWADEMRRRMREPFKPGDVINIDEGWEEYSRVVQVVDDVDADEWNRIYQRGPYYRGA